MKHIEVVFKPFADSGPAAGELHLRPRPSDARYALRLACLVLDRGLEAFAVRSGPISRMVVNHDPTLDDMLAMEFAQRLLAGQVVPPGCRPFAEYAANIREGLRTTNVPLQQSLEGIYLAIRRNAADLENSEDRSQFLEDWRLLAERIFQAAEAGVNPSVTPLLDKKDTAFAREQQYLAHDQEVYGESDVPRGERWFLFLPGGPPGGAAGLLLRQPKSILWKYWARDDPQAPGGKGYLFLAVDEEQRHWRFSTDPVKKVAIDSLACLLQEAEKAVDPAKAKADPWYDGSRHGHTLVAAPKAGTSLSDDQVLGLVRRWARAKPVSTPAFEGGNLLELLVRHFLSGAHRWRFALVGGAIVCLILFFLIPPHNNEEYSRGFVPVDDGSDPAVVRKGKDYALLIGIKEYENRWKRLNNPINDVRKIASVLQDSFGFETNVVENATQDEFLLALGEYTQKDYQEDDQLLLFFAGHGDFNEVNNLGYLVAKNSFLKDLTRKSYISTSDVGSMLERMKCKHILLVMDVCFGGTISLGTATGEYRGNNPGKEIPASTFVKRMMRHPTKRYICSSGKNVVSDGPPGGHSPFAEKVIEALEHDNENSSIVTADNLWGKVSYLTTEPQRGKFQGDRDNGDFLFIRKKKKEKSEETK